ncbi:UNVERIFIED_CONTAM: hypothetical protein Sangu_2911000 [Sesamum angustifolium]|uniref:Uncharacterized protein n=1 Tax=Sesamum angustifolium TaxID=2727405 RepID=A0AAW2IMN0_9LAMI
MLRELRRWMYNKNLPRRAGLTPEFEDGVKIFIECAKGQRGHMDGDQISGPYDYDESELANRLYIVVHAADHPLWDGCTQSQLGVVVELVDIKADDRISQWANIILPPDHTLPGDYYSTKKLRLYSSSETPDHMTLKHFDRMYSYFAKEPRNVRLGLCTYSFAPHGQYGRTYSCWPISITPYNLPPRTCMSFEYMFLTRVIPGLSNSKRLIDVYLEPLIEELL